MQGDTYPGAAGTVDGTVDEVLTHTLSSGTRSAGTTGAAASVGKGMGGGEGTRCCGDAGKRDGEGLRSGHKNGDGGSVGLKHCSSKFAAGTAGNSGGLRLDVCVCRDSMQRRGGLRVFSLDGGRRSLRSVREDLDPHSFNEFPQSVNFLESFFKAGVPGSLGLFHIDQFLLQLIDLARTLCTPACV